MRKETLSEKIKGDSSWSLSLSLTGYSYSNSTRGYIVIPRVHARGLGMPRLDLSNPHVEVLVGHVAQLDLRQAPHRVGNQLADADPTLQRPYR